MPYAALQHLYLPLDLHTIHQAIRAVKTLDLLQKDFAENGAFHEYYDPETGAGMFNKGFSSWNLLAFNMLAYFEGEELVEEFSM